MHQTGWLAASARMARGLGLAALLLSVAFMSGGGRAGAQDATPVATAGGATVTVIGHGTTTVTPDIATVTVGVMISQPVLADAQVLATEKMNDVIAAITAAGIEDKDVQTSNYSVNIVSNYDNMGSPTDVIGYQVSHQVNVTVRDLDTVGQLLVDVVDAGANTIWGISFGIEDPSAAAGESRAEAVADARTRAEQLAAAAGMTLGRVVSITEGTAFSIPYANSQFAGGKAGDGANIQAGSLEVSIDVQVTFELV